MSAIGAIIGLFSFRRISGQIAALILMSLILIHGVIAGYFLLNRPDRFTSEPFQQFELVARIMDSASEPERRVMVANVRRSFPELQLQWRDSAELPAGLPRSHSVGRLPPLDDRFELIRSSSGDNRIRYHFPDGAALDAKVGLAKPPAFMSGLWTSTLLFLLASVTLLAIGWPGAQLPAIRFCTRSRRFQPEPIVLPLAGIGSRGDQGRR